MGDRSQIEWTDATWNPWHGCHRVSPGCEHCYMFREKHLYGQDPEAVVRAKTTFNAPLRWRDSRRVFTCSWSDFFIKDADPWRDEAWAIIRQTPHLTYQILTKRPARIEGHLPHDWPLPNVWLGVSVECWSYRYRIDVLRQVPAAVRFVSFEPLISAIGSVNLDGIQWAIIGGESGPRAREFDLAWARQLITQCREAGTAVFVKQVGALAYDSEREPGGWCAETRIRTNDRKGGDPDEWPLDLRVREFPTC